MSIKLDIWGALIYNSMRNILFAKGKMTMYNDMPDSIGFLKNYDPELAASMERELCRQRSNIELIASENFVSPAVLAAMGSVLTNKYAEGYPGHRYYGGCCYVDEVENIARDRACKLFGAEHANVQPHSGAQANLAAYFALAEYGDTIMGMDLSQGGHLTHGSPVNYSGKTYHFVSYGVDIETGMIDYDRVREIALECKPKIIVAGASAYPRAIDFSKFREIADEVGAYLMVDMAHIAGLSPPDFICRRFPMPTLLPAPPTKPCAAPGADLFSARKNMRSKSTKRFSPELRAVRWNI